jgi:hypothetical protein
MWKDGSTNKLQPFDQKGILDFSSVNTKGSLSLSSGREQNAGLFGSNRLHRPSPDLIATAIIAILGTEIKCPVGR